jgi:outer membrane protein assembly factor BamB
LFAYDAAGSQGCGGSPRTCAPLWTGDLACCEISAPVVVGNTVYVTASDGELAAFDVNGGPNCTTATPKVCQPLWSRTLDVEVRKSAIAVANGRVYVGGIASRGTGEVEVFDAAGTSTAPLWIGVLPGPVDTSLVVVNGVLYLGATDRKLYAYDALGATNCAGDVGTHTCLPIWTAPTGDLITFDAPAVADGKLYVGTNDGLFTFDANGSTNCAGSPKTCAPISTTSGPLGLAPPTVANGVVYVGSVDGTLDTLQACSTVGPDCTPLIGSVATGAAVGSPVVAGGAVYVRSGTNVQAYRLG